MNEEQTMAEKILAALPWRCFHCDFVTCGIIAVDGSRSGRWR